jgi:hypothetical protein
MQELGIYLLYLQKVIMTLEDKNLAMSHAAYYKKPIFKSIYKTGRTETPNTIGTGPSLLRNLNARQSLL